MKHLSLLGGLCLACAACSQEKPDPTPMLFKAVAGFTIPATISAQTVLQPQNTSVNATSYTWAWGDGSSSTASAPTHTYTKTGNVRLLLTVTGSGGTDTISKVLNVTPAPAPTGLDGQYRGQLYISSYGGSPYYSVRRDTTILVTQPSTQTLVTFGRTVSYLPGTSFLWGRKPDRSSYAYINSASFGSTTVVQKEMAGDSIHIESRSGGLGGGIFYSFYGKK